MEDIYFRNRTLSGIQQIAYSKNHNIIQIEGRDHLFNDLRPPYLINYTQATEEDWNQLQYILSKQIAKGQVKVVKYPMDMTDTTEDSFEEKDKVNLAGPEEPGPSEGGYTLVVFSQNPNLKPRLTYTDSLQQARVGARAIYNTTDCTVFICHKPAVAASNGKLYKEVLEVFGELKEEMAIMVCMEIAVSKPGVEETGASL